MSVSTLASTNGSAPRSSYASQSDASQSDALQSASAAHASDAAWLQLSTQQFFSRFNWDDNPPEVQQLRQNTVAGSTAPLSMTLTVSQFLGAINWDGEAIAQSHPAAQAPLDDLSGADIFTLDSFSDLF